PTEQARTVLQSIRGHRLEALYTVALVLGLRQGEALGLRWEDVDLEGGSLRVCQTLQRVDGTLRFAEPKTERSRRKISMPEMVARSLRQHRLHQVEERLMAGSKWQENGLVFTSTIGTPLDGTNVTHILHRLLEEAGLPRIRFHDLRHTCASLLLAEGIDLRVIMEVLGHSQISLTANTYAHIQDPLKRDAAAKLDAALGS
ncbi:MAG: site-specific integrase, partial [Chloroflexota bacterium]